MDYPMKPQGFEIALMMMLPSQYHWLILLFRDAADQLWSWLSVLIPLYVIYRILVYLVSRNVTAANIEALLTRLLHVPINSIARTIAARAEDIVQRHTDAAMTDMVARLTVANDDLAIAADTKHAADQDAIIDLKEQLDFMDSLFQGKLPVLLRRAISTHVEQVARTATQRATDTTVRSLVCSASRFNAEHVIGRKENTDDHDLSILNVSQLWAELQRLRKESKEQIDRFQYSAERQFLNIDRQAESIATLTNQIDTLTASITAMRAQVIELQMTSNTQAIQLKSLPEITANISRLDSTHRTSTEPHGQSMVVTDTMLGLKNKIQSLEAHLQQEPNGSMSILSNLEAKFQDLDQKLEQSKAETNTKLQGLEFKLSNASTSIETLLETNMTLDGRLDEIEDAQKTAENKHDTTAVSDGRTKAIEATLAELVETTQPLRAIEDRTTAMEATVVSHTKSFKQLQGVPSNIADVAERLHNCENRLISMQPGMTKIAGDIFEIRSDIRSQLEKLETHERWMKDDWNDMKEVKEGMNELQEDVQELQECTDDHEAQIKELQKLDKDFDFEQLASVMATNNAAMHTSAPVTTTGDLQNFSAAFQPTLFTESRAPWFGQGFSSTEGMDFDDAFVPTSDPSLTFMGGVQDTFNPFSLNSAAPSTNPDSPLVPLPDVAATQQNAVNTSGSPFLFSNDHSGATKVLQTTPTTESEQQDEMMADLDPENPPDMDEEFNNAMLAGEERSESDSEDESEAESEAESSTDAEGEIVDEAELLFLYGPTMAPSERVLEGTEDW